MSEDRSWFGRTFDAGKASTETERGEHGRPGDPSRAGAKSLPESRPETPPRSASAEARREEEIRLAAKAETLAACAALAHTYEKKGASAGLVRVVLTDRATEAWNRLEAHHHGGPLVAAPNIGEGAATSGPLRAGDNANDEAASVSSSATGVTAHAPSSPTPSGTGEPTKPVLDTAAGGGASGLGLTAHEPEPSPAARLTQIADCLNKIVVILDGKESRPVFGGAAGKSLVKYLRDLEDVARGKRRIVTPAPEPQSLDAHRVPPAKLTIVR